METGKGMEMENVQECQNGVQPFVPNKKKDNQIFSNNRLTSEMERGIILVNKDKHAIFIISLMVYKIRRQTI